MRILIVSLFCSLVFPATAQQPDTLAPRLDTLPPAAASTTAAQKAGFVHRFFSKDYPNPRKAAFLSLALPGAGQAYNKRWWKLPFVYATLGVTTYIMVDNLKEYQRLRDSYKLLVDDDPNTNPTEAPYSLLDATSTKEYRDLFRRYFEQSAIAVGLAYVLTATEAFVDAHLSRFDVSDDLTLRIAPKTQTAPGYGLVFGVGVALQLKGKNQPATPGGIGLKNSFP